MFSPFLNKIRWLLCILWDAHQLFLHEGSLWYISLVIHYIITGTQPDFAQSVSLLRPYPISGSLVLVVIVLCQVVISNDTIHPQAVCPLGDNSLDELKEIKGNSFSSIASLGFILVIWVSVSLSQSTNPYRCLTQVDNIFFRIVQLLCILDLNPSYTQLFRTHTLYQGGGGGGGHLDLPY